MATTSQRPGKRGKQQQPSHAGHRASGNGSKEYFAQHPMASSMSSCNLPGVYSNPEMAYALVGIVGCIVDVQMQSGIAYQGILKAVSPQLSVALALAHDKTKEASTENTEKLMQLEFADIVSVSVLPDSNPSLNSKDIFKTDAEISRTNGSGLSRELQPFTFDEDPNSLTSLIDTPSTGTDTGWTAEDMFEINKSKFHVESSYDEEMPEYTTKLDRSETKDFQRRQDRAARLAREIETNSDRYRMDDAGTEEELFSSVVRQQVAVAAPPSSIPRSLPKDTPPTPQLPPPPPPPAQNSSGPVENRADMKCPEEVWSDPNSTHSCIGTSYSSPSLTTVNSSRDSHVLQSDGTEKGKEESKLDDATTTVDGGSVAGSSAMEDGTAACTTMEGGGSAPGSTATADSTVVDTTATETSEKVTGMTPPTEGGAEAEKEDKTEGAAMPPNMDPATPPNAASEPEKDTSSPDKPGLDPNAKVFVPSFLPATSSATSIIPPSSSAPAVIDSTYYRPPSAGSHLTGKKFAKRSRSHTPVTFTPQDPVSYVSTAGGYMIAQTPQLAVMRTPLQQVSNGQLIQYSTGLPQYAQPYGGGYINPQTLSTPQHYADISSQQQIYAGSQQFPVHHQLIQPSHGQGQVTTAATANQSGLVATHQAVVNPQMMLVPGHTVGGASTSPVSMYPHMQVAGFMGGQNQGVVAQNRYIYSTQQPPN